MSSFFETYEHLRNVWIPPQPGISVSHAYFAEAGMGYDFDTSMDWRNPLAPMEVKETKWAELAVWKKNGCCLYKTLLKEVSTNELTISQIRAFLLANRGSSERFSFYTKSKDGYLLTINATWGLVRGISHIEDRIIQDYCALYVARLQNNHSPWFDNLVLKNR